MYYVVVMAILDCVNDYEIVNKIQIDLLDLHLDLEFDNNVDFVSDRTSYNTATWL